MAAPEPGTLAGVGVLVTRPAHQAEELARRIEAEGGRALRFATIEIAPPADPAALERVLARLGEFDLAVFVSRNAVERVQPLIAAHGGWPARLQLAAVGAATAAALERAAGRAVLAPRARFDSEALLALPELQQVRGRRIAIFRGAGGRALLGATLAARGAEVVYAECYRRAAPAADPAELTRRWADGEIQIVTVTSVEALHNLEALLDPQGRALLRATPLLVVSARLAQAARALGCTRVLTARAAGDEALVEAIKTWRARQNSL
jgi:uroporphyrinogen-III synthase